MSNGPRPITEPDEAEKARRQDTTVQAIARSIVEKREAKLRNQWKEELRELELPDDADVPAIVRAVDREERAPALSLARLTSPTHYLYSRMSEEEQAIRNPDTDHWMHEWLKGLGSRDHARMQECTDRLEAHFGYRADIVEGAPGASGALSAGTGGALIPRPLEALVNIARDRVAVARRVVNVLGMTAQTHTIPTSAALTKGMVAEGAAIGDGAPTYASVQVSARKGGLLAVYSQEVLADQAVNVISNLSQRAGGALAELEDDQVFADGDGTGANISETINGTAFSEAVAGTLSYADVVNMYMSVPKVYRAQGVWLVATNVLQLLTSLLNANGVPFYSGLQQSTVGVLVDDPMQDGTMLRKPVYECAFPDGTIFFGDARAVYTLGARAGIMASVSEHVGFTSDLVNYKFTERFDGINVDAIAGQKAEGITIVS